MAPAPERAVVVPVKGGPLAKSRLALPRPARLALADALARDTVEAAAGLPGTPVLVVTADPLAALWAVEAGHRVVDDPGGGLDAAASAGLAAAVEIGAGRAAVLLGDHPALGTEELRGCLALTGLEARAFVADADGTGTALLDVALTVSVLPRTAFGAGSAAAHTALGYTRVTADAPGLVTDVDDARSLEAALALGVGRHTRAALARATLPGVQATIHRVPGDAGGSALLDDGREVAVPLEALTDSGLLHLRVGQRVSLELDPEERHATRVWIVGIGPGETIR